MTNSLYKELKENEEIQIGDLVVAKHPLIAWQKRVTRVTKKYCFVRWNELSETKFPRTYGVHFKTVPRDTYNNINYTVYRKTYETPSAI